MYKNFLGLFLVVTAVIISGYAYKSEWKNREDRRYKHASENTEITKVNESSNDDKSSDGSLSVKVYDDSEQEIIDESDNLILAGRYSEAVEKLSSLTEADKSKPRYFLQTSVALWHMGQREKALEIYENHVNAGKDSTIKFTNKAHFHYETGNFKEALSLAQKAVELDPEDPGALYVLGLAYLKTDNPKKALEAFDKTLKTIPEGERKYDVQISRATVLTELDRWQEAEEALLYALSSRKKNLLVYLKLAEIYDFVEKPRKTLAAVRAMEMKNVEKDPYFSRKDHLVEFYLVAGGAYQENEEYNKSIDYFNKAKSIDPFNPQIYFRRGYTYFEKGDMEEAKEDMNYWLESNPSMDSEENVEKFGWAYAILGDKTESLYYVDKALVFAKGEESAFENKRMLVVKGEILHMFNDSKGAMECFRLAGVLTDKQAMEDLASAYWEKVIKKYIKQSRP